jgi:hypothetical protein
MIDSGAFPGRKLMLMRTMVLLLPVSVIACGAPMKSAAPVESARRVALAGEAPAASGGGEAEPPEPAASKPARMVIKTAELEIITSDLREGFEKATAMAKSLGGFTLSSDRSEDRIRITLRIPAAGFEQALCRLAKLGKVDRREVSGRDVTAQFVDLTLRLKNAQRMHRRYLELLARAANVTETLKVQTEIERVTNTIESLKGQINLIENQVSLSTIHLTLEEPTRPGPLGWIFYALYKGVVWLFVW